MDNGGCRFTHSCLVSLERLLKVALAAPADVDAIVSSWYVVGRRLEEDRELGEKRAIVVI